VGAVEKCYTAIRRLIGGWLMEAENLYLNRRAIEERLAAMRAAHPRARKAHLDLAEHYEMRLRAAEAVARRSAVRLVAI
jgi:uncharacterized protein (DUF2461 family)